MTLITQDPYPITIGNATAALENLLTDTLYSKIGVLVDENTQRHCLPLLPANLPKLEPLVIAAGEVHKNLDTCRQVWSAMFDGGLDRHSLLINLGGGVIGDLGGFCAATFMRGIDFVQVPTTLLAQVDASIGGKLGVNLGAFKNGIGLFKNPFAVCIDPAFLATLPARELRSGLAEVAKHALIADHKMWASLRNLNDLQRTDWEALIQPAIRIKHQIVETDPKESGRRKILNFGHTIGHALESLALQQNRPLTHGEAIAAGIICESWLSHRMLGLPQSQLLEIQTFIQRFFQPFAFGNPDLPSLFQWMAKDKKNRAATPHFTLINPIGKAHYNQICPESLVKGSLEYYSELANNW